MDAMLTLEASQALSGGPTSGALDDLVRATDGDDVRAAFRPALDSARAIEEHIVRARLVSARMVALERSERIGGHTSSLGHEGAIVGAALAARPTDWIFPGPREWYAALARGMPLAEYVHHAFGSAEDPTRGHSPPDHAPGRRYRVVPPSGIVGAHLPQAVGAAWAAKIDRSDVAVLCLFGAKIVASGDFHNAMNFAGVFKTPVVFVCRSDASALVAARAVAYGIASARVDGSDALAVLTVVRAALDRARAGDGATVVEVVSPVLPALASVDELAPGAMLDLGEGDPLTVLRRVLAREGLASGSGQEDLARAVASELDQAIAAAERAGSPRPDTIFEHVYAELPLHLAAQRRELTGGTPWGR